MWVVRHPAGGYLTHGEGDTYPHRGELQDCTRYLTRERAGRDADSHGGRVVRIRRPIREALGLSPWATNREVVDSCQALRLYREVFHREGGK